ncbi:glycosyltransferase family 39 protein [Aureimonas sp. AU12]|uniref:ArnT family glycosyltransferase n=1 Tax=Aureimonas sp. AU12 TaxID=1638161 RepID=UPI00078482B1|nr:glycosyltransferase family 39 protein [Aureimonas sp. AU12]
MKDATPGGVMETASGTRAATEAHGMVWRLAPYLALALLCAASLASRPLLPPDETRYLTVAFEMLQSKGWFVPTLNFAPYHHKPPLLFWLIDLSWSVFGVGRAQAMLVVFAVSSLVLRLTQQAGRALWPEREDVARRIPWLMLGSVPFVVYSSLVLFDLLLTACILSAFLALLAFARGRGRRWAVLAGFAIGFGVLAKGPVVLVHVVWPFALYPLWRTKREIVSGAAFARGAGLAFLAALLPVALWLVPALLKTDGQFARDLVWEQSAGRISGNMEASHPRPVFFYLLMLPLLAMPWMLSPDLWRTRPLQRLSRALRGQGDEGRTSRLLLLWGLGILVVFSAISGKQPHYLVPMLALTVLALARAMAPVSLERIRIASLATVAVLALAQGIASPLYFAQFDLAPVSALIEAKGDAPVGFVGRYQGELGFLARLRRPVDLVAAPDAASWLAAHPGGTLVVADRRDVADMPPEALEIAYRGRRLALFGPSALPDQAR